MRALKGAAPLMRVASLALLVSSVGGALIRIGWADSNVAAESSYAWGANIGWVDWCPDLTLGAEFGQFVCSGYLYAPNAGWISVGNGAPLNGIQYSNDSAADFGVNVDASGNLRGFAYGANIGWVNFEGVGAPRVSLSTGRLAGFAYGANVGWINLGDSTFGVVIDSMSPGADTDRDGIPDAWELSMTGNLSSLTADGDLDGDNQSDLLEYLADTDPTDPGDQLRLEVVASGTTIAFTWMAQPTRQYQVETRLSLTPEEGWQAAGAPELGSGMPLTRTLPVTGTQAYFRVRALRPLIP
jgi:hypothetical protein